MRLPLTMKLTREITAQDIQRNKLLWLFRAGGVAAEQLSTTRIAVFVLSVLAIVPIVLLSPATVSVAKTGDEVGGLLSHHA